LIFVRSPIRLILITLTLWFSTGAYLQAVTPRSTLVNAMLADDDTRKLELVSSLAGEADEAIQPLLNAWRADALYIYEPSDGVRIPVQLVGEKDADDANAALRVDTGAPLVDGAGKPIRLIAGDLKAVEHNSALRRAMKGVLDLIDVTSPDVKKRIQAIHARSDRCNFARRQKTHPGYPDHRVRSGVG
jgi:urea transport system permease protein